MSAKKSKTIVLKMVLAVIVLLLLAGGGVFAKIKYEQSKMHPLETGEVIPGVFAVKNDFVNFYLIESGDTYIAVDAGTGRFAAEKELERLGISGEEVSVVLLTHTHGDHVGAWGLFNGAVVYMGAGSTTSKQSYRTLSDGETLTLANASVQCIATPGHTDDSVCYLINGQYLFVGDTLSLQGNQVGLFNSFFNKSDEVQAESQRKLAALGDIPYMFSGHYGYTQNAQFPPE